MAEFESVRQIIHWSLLIVGAICMLRACSLMLFRRPARAEFIYDGYRKARRERDAAVFLSERAHMPLTVSDIVEFTTQSGQQVRAEIKRHASPQDRSVLVWYCPDDPKRATMTGPMTWAWWSLASLGTAAWFFWF